MAGTESLYVLCQLSPLHIAHKETPDRRISSPFPSKTWDFKLEGYSYAYKGSGKNHVREKILSPINTNQFSAWPVTPKPTPKNKWTSQATEAPRHYTKQSLEKHQPMRSPESSTDWPLPLLTLQSARCLQRALRPLKQTRKPQLNRRNSREN